MENININKPLWFNDKSIKEDLEHFRELYKSRPIKNNSGGMLSTHMFYVWFTAKKINPELIIDSYNMSIDESVATILRYLKKKGIIS